MQKWTRLRLAVLVAAHGACAALVVACVNDLPTEGPIARTSSAAIFAPTKAMSTPRMQHTATLLQDGRVLVTGGDDGVNQLASAEVWDPSTGAWTTVGSLSVSRRFHTATLLADGRVLVVGGNAALQSAEIFDPKTLKFTLTKPLAIGRWQHRAARLANGKVLAVGGYITSTAELYDPAADTWTAAASMSVPRYLHDAVLLSTGKVLVAGGGNGTAGFTVSELYDPSADAWASSGAIPSAREMTFTVSGGKVFSAGGWPPSTAVWSYDPATGLWSDAGTLAAGQPGPSVTLADGRILLPGIYLTGGQTQIFDPVTRAGASVSPLLVGRTYHSVTLFSSGKVLIAGGQATGGPTASAEVFSYLQNGEACAAASAAECGSKLCVDGVCCNASCGGACSACDVAGSVGACAAVASGAPHGARSCSPFGLCAAGACVSGCVDDTGCDSTHFCSVGACIAKKGAGATCAAKDECQSGFCVDGVCCDVACGRQCEACDVAGKVGTCATITGYPHGGRPACTGTGVGTVCGPQCNGVEPVRCIFPTASAPCSGNTCHDGIETHGSNCDGAGSCFDVPKSCNAYACDTTSCRTTCTNAGDCAAGYFCEIPSGLAVGACLPTKGLGTPCTKAATCGSGFCTDGVCCGVASCGAGSTCAGPGSKSGVCSRSQGTPCALAAECASGACVDGVCCDSACAGQCQACDVKGSEGTCIPVRGAPHVGRAPCPDGGAEVCAALACDGKDTLRCAAFAYSTEKECGAASCDHAVRVAAPRCDGLGACKTSSPAPCAPFACDGTDCLASCATAADCAPGNTCAAGACVPGASCTADRRGTIGKDGAEISCAPYLCLADGSCGGSCASSGDCVGGFVCDVASARCQDASANANASSGGGCAFGAGDRAASDAGLALIGLAGAMVLGRRRRSGRRSS